MQRRSLLSFAAYCLVAAIHLVIIGFDLPGQDLTKWLLMPTLLVVVLVVGLRGPAVRPAALALLCGGIAASWAGDVLLGTAGFIPGLGAFALAHILYVVLFVGPARARRIPWPALLYVVWLAVLVPMLWPHLGSQAPAVVVYGALLAATAATAWGVSSITGWGALAFLASDSLLAFRLFWPDVKTTFPDPWQDMTIMALYCVGQGVIAFGVLRRLQRTERPAPAPTEAAVAR